jgi:hypothetical protein
MLQAVWLAMVFKVAYKVLTGQGAEDVRTDEEGYVLETHTFSHYN